MEKKFEANFPPVINKAINKTFPACTVTFIAMANGNWVSSDGDSMFADEVAEWCRSALNWREIKAAHFPMDGFSDYENFFDNSHSHKTDY